jgi:hypothetical protein
MTVAVSTKPQYAITQDGTSSPEMSCHPLETGLGTFTCLPRLPPELRLTIWEYAASQPRNVDIWTNRTHNSPRDVYPSFHYSTLSPVPAILQVNREARHVGMSFYELAFSQSFEDDNGDEIESLRRPGMYVNWRSDLICLLDLWRWDIDALGPVFQNKKIKHLALNVEAGDWRCAWFLGLRLETLTLYRVERSFRLAQVLNFRSKKDFKIAFVGVDKAHSSPSVEEEGELDLLTRAQDKVLAEFEELENLQKLWDESLDRGHYVTAEVLRSPLFGDAFSRSAGWLKGDEEVVCKRPRPDIKFAKICLGDDKDQVQVPGGSEGLL